MLNLFEHPIAADLDGRPGVEIVKGGLTLNGLVNLGIAVGQNLPYNHVLQAWDAATGSALAAFPQAVEDYQLLSSPAVADVGGGAEREAIVGTGLYLLRAISASGAEPARLPEVHRRLALRRARHGRRGRRRQARHRGRHARGPRVPVEDRPPRLRRQRRVVDLAPRRALHRRPRHRHAPARHRPRPGRDVQGRQGAARPGRRPATTGCAAPRRATRSATPPARSSRPARAAAPPPCPARRAIASRSPSPTRPATGACPPSSRPSADCRANEPRIASRWQDAAWRASSACSGSTRSSRPPTGTSAPRSTTRWGSSRRSRSA